MLNDLVRLYDARPIDRNALRHVGSSVVIPPPAPPLTAAATVQFPHPDPSPAAVVSIRVELLPPREQPREVVEAPAKRALPGEMAPQPGAASAFEPQSYGRAMAAYNLQRTLSEPPQVRESRPRLDVRA